MVRRSVVLSLVLIFIGGLTASAAPAAKPVPEKPATPKQDDYELLKILVDTMDQVERNYVKDVDRRELMEAAIQGMLAKLDPYSSYINPQETGQFRSSMESEFGGIGIQLDVDAGVLRVLSPLVGTPAYRAGVMAGDRIVEIGGQSTEGMPREEAIRRLKGRPGTEVTISVVHADSSDRKKITLTREVIHVDTVMGYRHTASDAWDFMLDHDKHIGYVRLTAFSRDTARDLRKALEELRAAKLRGLILDLRFNPGGLLNAAIEVSGLFISKGRIVSTAGRNSPERAWDAQSGDTFEGFPMALLVNRFSASASEIVSACLQDHNRAIVVGERTWGKGSVQNVIELEGGQSLLKLTTASYRRPSGKNIHRFPDSKEDDQWGVMPDKGYQLKLGDREMVGLIHDRRVRDVVQPHPSTPAGDSQTQSKKGDRPPSGGKPLAKSTAEKPSGEKSSTEKTSGEKPSREKKADPTPAQPAAEKAAKATKGLAAKPAKPDEFVDRQLQMALDYLTGELARAEKPQ